MSNHPIIRQDAIPMKATPAAEPMTNKEPPVAAQ